MVLRRGEGQPQPLGHFEVLPKPLDSPVVRLRREIMRIDPIAFDRGVLDLVNIFEGPVRGYFVLIASEQLGVMKGEIKGRRRDRNEAERLERAVDFWRIVTNRDVLELKQFMLREAEQDKKTLLERVSLKKEMLDDGFDDDPIYLRLERFIKREKESRNCTKNKKKRTLSDVAIKDASERISQTGRAKAEAEIANYQTLIDELYATQKILLASL